MHVCVWLLLCEVLFYAVAHFGVDFDTFWLV